ncbi:MAG: hypothetical protein HYX61_03815 [Gammaproteobacteria bacterium]|nr:hypothetical protein [Gammaproteobacteria bacterium]
MLRKVLFILSGVVIVYSATGFAKDAIMFKEFRSIPGEYNEYRVTGYNIQPNRPGVWDRGCRTDNYYCTAQLERCRSYEGISFAEPKIVKNRR